jgi:hypothetical protein
VRGRVQVSVRGMAAVKGLLGLADGE